MPVNTFLLQQLIVITALEHLALSKNIDDVGLLDSSQTMSNSNGSSALRDTFKSRLNKFLARC